VKLPASFTTKLGPAPAWVWGAGLGALLIVVGLMRSRERADAIEPEVPDAPTTDDEFYGEQPLTPLPGPGFGFRPAPPTTPITPPVEPPPARRRYRTNNEWRSAALDHLTSNGEPEALAYNALARFLRGDRLNRETEGPLVREALRVLGQPPKPPPMIRWAPPGKHPKPPPPRRPPTARRPWDGNRPPTRPGLPYEPSGRTATGGAGEDTKPAKPIDHRYIDDLKPPPVHRPIDDIKPPPVHRPIDDIKPPPAFSAGD